ncbi:RNA polymerase, sigma-24 subunit, ECF subfamily (plasmid) [Thermus thermophilus SG0.5JP17-16]|uniref:RNA polymerase, sigma-24 subunit, ECF subfamily n=1 Tax=Thermus thermophilus (strain SG0.5JP17-16) TaxID=762633 RepID=F6DIQ3_THETG|nr:sigma-70 family RNA polymerase sigma factor [Thermus thermophilus]AEG34719.1 RNA polymerase, sigma-24 subunit, ECF subfamily [Thermus thermophilus SG0.5JP17-16]
MGEEAEEIRLLCRVALGDEEALLALYRRYAPRVHGLARRILRDGHEAKDVVQETFLRIWNQAERFDPALGRPATWILTIAHRLALKRLKALKPLFFEEEGAEERVGGDNHLDRIRVAQALKALSPEERKLLELAYFQGYSHSELALLLGWPLGTVKSRIRRALAKLEGKLR